MPKWKTAAGLLDAWTLEHQPTSTRCRLAANRRRLTIDYRRLTANERPASTDRGVDGDKQSTLTHNAALQHPPP